MWHVSTNGWMGKGGWRFEGAAGARGSLALAWFDGSGVGRVESDTRRRGRGAGWVEWRGWNAGVAGGGPRRGGGGMDGVDKALGWHCEEFAGWARWKALRAAASMGPASCA